MNARNTRPARPGITRLVPPWLLVAMWLETCVLPLRGWAQPTEENLAFAPRYDAFRLVLASQGAQLGTLDEFFNEDPSEWENWLVVVLGNPDALQPWNMNWAGFVHGGGRLLIAYDGASRALHPFFRVSFRLGPVVAPQLLAYHGARSCPILTEFPDHPLFRGVSLLALNQAGFLMDENAHRWALARLPDGTGLGDALFSNPPPVIVARELGRGRLVFTADQTLFANAMIMQPDLGNLRFARNTVAWLGADREDRPLRLLLLEEGAEAPGLLDPRFESGDWPAGRIPPSTPPNWWKDWPTLLSLFAKAVNGVVAELENENRERVARGLPSFWDEIARRGEQALKGSPMHRVLLFLATLLLAWFLVCWFWGARRSPFEQPAALGISTTSPLYQRQDAVLASGAFNEPARNLVQAFFSRWLVHPDWNGKLPPTRIHRNGWQRWRLRGKLCFYWNLATGKTRRPLRWQQFQQLQENLVFLQALTSNKVIEVSNPGAGVAYPKPGKPLDTTQKDGS